MHDSENLSHSLQFPPPRERATFYGTSRHKVADKTNQVAIPKTQMHVLEAAQEKDLILIHFPDDPFLRLYTKKAFDKKMDEVEENEKIAAGQKVEVLHWMAGESEQFEPDKQGRFVLPKEFVDRMENKEVVFQGALAFIKVWPADQYEAGKIDPRKWGPVKDPASAEHKWENVKELVKSILDSPRRVA